MKIVTESLLRNQLKEKILTELHEFIVADGTIVTPSARSFLTDNKIELKYQPKPPIPSSTETPEPLKHIGVSEEVSNQLTSAPSNLPSVQKTSLTDMAGGYYNKKPEHMTHLYGSCLVNKDHPLIALRGAIDCFEANIMDLQIKALKHGQHTLVDHLQEIIEYVQRILRAEVTQQPLAPMNLLGLNGDEIRARSHDPKKYFDINHFLPTYHHGETVVCLNRLRSQVRSLELCAYTAFKDEYGLPRRADILEALNRLSSLFYIMMFQALKMEYES